MIGIYGGTFNPIHVGHLRAAEEVVEQLDLERMLFVPSARPPHKSTEAHEIAPAALRLAWVAAAIAGNERFAVDPIEVERPGPSYLVDTLRALRARHAGRELVFVVGQDAFSEMGSWRTPREIFRLCHVAVMTRPPAASGVLGDWLPVCARPDFALDPGGERARHREAGTVIRTVAITSLDVSSSAIRERIRGGQSIRYLVPDAVHDAILASNTYAAEARDEAVRTVRSSGSER